MTAVAITSPGAFIPASVCAAIRHGLRRDLEAALRNRESVSDEIVATVELVESIGAWWDNKRVSSGFQTLDRPSFDAVEWISMFDASVILEITPQAVGRLRKRGSLRSEKVGRSWRIDKASVLARKAEK
jgi:hypothetical protein